MREPGNTSGVARITFPNESGTYLVTYFSGDTILGETSVHVPTNNDSQFQSTFDTENYSPKFLSTLKNNFSVFTIRESTSLLEPNIEQTGIEAKNHLEFLGK